MNTEEEEEKKEIGLKSSHADRMKRVHEEMQETYEDLYLGIRKVQRLDETLIERDVERKQAKRNEN